jgi:hypothetical protein
MLIEEVNSKPAGRMSFLSYYEYTLMLILKDKEPMNDRTDELMRLIQSHEDPIEAAFEYFITLVHVLADAGWTAEKLCDDVNWHVANQTSVGMA